METPFEMTHKLYLVTPMALYAGLFYDSICILPVSSFTVICSEVDVINVVWTSVIDGGG